MALLVMISTIVSFSPLGSQKVNYVANVERVQYVDCLKVKAAISKHHVVTCIKEH